MSHDVVQLLASTLLFLSCAAPQIHRPTATLTAPADPQLEMSSLVVLTQRFRDHAEVLQLSTADVATFAVGDTVARALEEECRLTFKSSRVAAADTDAAEEVIVEPYGAAVTMTGGTLQLKLDVVVSRRDRPSHVFRLVEKHDTKEAALSVEARLVERVLARFRTELRAELAGAPLPASPPRPALSQSDVLEVVKLNVTRIKRCVDQQRAAQPRITGRLTMKWRILPSGLTTDIVIFGSEPPDLLLGTCITREISRWVFPESQDPGDPIVFPFTF